LPTLTRPDQAASSAQETQEQPKENSQPEAQPETAAAEEPQNAITRKFTDEEKTKVQEFWVRVFLLTTFC
jgi:hypothetical protein